MEKRELIDFIYIVGEEYDDFSNMGFTPIYTTNTEQKAKSYMKKNNLGTYILKFPVGTEVSQEWQDYIIFQKD